jgi:hypothetical protein
MTSMDYKPKPTTKHPSLRGKREEDKNEGKKWECSLR